MLSPNDVYALLPKYEQETGRVIHSQDNHNHVVIGVVLSFGDTPIQCIKKIPMRQFGGALVTYGGDPKEVALRVMEEVCTELREIVEGEGFK